MVSGERNAARYAFQSLYLSPKTHPDTTLIPPGTQYGATLSKAGKRKPLTYAGFISPCKPMQRTNYHLQ